MKTSKAILLTVLSLLSLAFTLLPGELQEVHFNIEPSSRLLLNGTSNINEFSCDCDSYNHSGKVLLEPSDKGYWQFREAILSVEVKAFDCGHSGINRDMGIALKAHKYPHITISLKSLFHDDKLQHFHVGEKRDLHAIVDIALAGTTKRTPIFIHVTRLSESEYNISCEKDLFMSDFGVDPPTALFGLVKVNDLINISIYLDLILS
jgi:hypothetical protein